MKYTTVRWVMALATAAASPAAAGAPAQTAPKPGSGSGPPGPYTSVRWNEDYAYLKDPALRTDPFDAIKYVPLNEAGDWYLSLGGQVRERYEFFDDNTFGAGPQDGSGYLLSRVLAHADLHMGEHLRGFVQLKSALEFGREGGPRPQDVDEFDVQQAFLDLKLPLGREGGGRDSFTLRGGRQELIYGAERIISPLDWTNTRRTFEGGKGSFVLGPHALDLFWVRPVVVHDEKFNEGDENTSFAGVYDAIALPEVLPRGNTKLDLYGLALNRRTGPAQPEGAEVPTTPAVTVDSDTYTIGARFSSNPKPFDFDVEASYQFGKSGGGDISAWSLAAEGGYTVAAAPLTPRLYLGFDIASGDDDPADPDLQTFNQLFPLSHAYFGYVDVIGRQNIVDLHPGVQVVLLQDQRFAKKLTLRADYHLFWRESEADAVYSASGGVLRAASGSGERFIGSEVDLLINWQIDRHVAAYVGYSHFFAGDFLEETGPHEGIDFAYVAVTFTF